MSGVQQGDARFLGVDKLVVLDVGGEQGVGPGGQGGTHQIGAGTGAEGHRLDGAVGVQVFDRDGADALLHPLGKVPGGKGGFQLADAAQVFGVGDGFVYKNVVGRELIGVGFLHGGDHPVQALRRADHLQADLVGPFQLAHLPQEGVRALLRLEGALAGGGEGAGGIVPQLAGAGQLGDYSACTFSTPGQGTFQPEEGAHPFLGQVGQLERADEVRLEMICPPECLDRVVAAMKEAHPYELPAYDVFVDEAVAHTEYLGRIGQLEAPLSPRDFAQRVKERIGAVSVKYLDADRPIQTVALCSGSGADLMSAALAAGADALLTADVKHNQFIDAQEAGITLLDAGHFDTEDLVLEPLAQRLEALLPEVPFLVTHYSNIRAV